MNLIELTKKLVSYKSYFDKSEGINEKYICEFIHDYLRELHFLEVRKQQVEEERFNVIASDGFEPRLMFCCHMDTVQPQTGWKYDKFAGVIENDKLFGLGAADMKGGIACLLAALNSFRQTKGLLFLFDVGEEYDFKGMKKFLEGRLYSPEFALFLEPTGMQISNGQRGLIEVHFRTRGQTARASRPSSGKNAILGTTRAVEDLIKIMKKHYKHPSLGESSCNLAYLLGGLSKGERGEGQWLTSEDVGREGNNVPDIAEVVVDIGPAVPELNAESVINILRHHLEKNRFTMENSRIRHDKSPMFIPREHLRVLEEVVQKVIGEVKYSDLRWGAYGEMHMLNKTIGTNCAMLGPGPGKAGHEPNEYVLISDMRKTRDVFTELIKRCCTPC